MNDVLSKVIGMLLAFALLVLAPVTIARMTDDMSMKRRNLGEAQTFIDMVTDKGSATKEDVDGLLLGLNAHGGVFDAVITLYRRYSYPDTSHPDGIRSLYIPTDDTFGGQTVTLRSGDIIKVRVYALESSSAQKLLAKLLRVYEPDFSFTLAGMAR